MEIARTLSSNVQVSYHPLLCMAYSLSQFKSDPGIDTTPFPRDIDTCDSSNVTTDVRYQPVIFWFFDYDMANGTAILCSPSVTSTQVLASIDAMTKNTTVRPLQDQTVGNPGSEIGRAYNALFFPNGSLGDSDTAPVEVRDAQLSLPAAALRAARMNYGSQSLSTEFEVQAQRVYVRSYPLPHTRYTPLTCHTTSYHFLQNLYLQLTAQSLYLVPLESSVSARDARVQVMRQRVLLVYVYFPRFYILAMRLLMSTYAAAPQCMP